MRDRHLEQLWSTVHSRLRASFAASVYDAWLARLGPVSRERSTLYVETPAESRAWVERRFARAIGTAVSAADPSIERVELITPAAHTVPAAAEYAGEYARTERVHQGFDSFVIGHSNRFAHAAALAVAELPGGAYNPLFIHGPSGVGKTHLLRAIVNHIEEHDPALAPRYITAEAFTSHFTNAIHRGGLDRFKHSIRSADVLLLDDVHFLEGKPKTAEEVFHTLDRAVSSGRQVITAADRHPSRITSLQAPLRQRLQGGLVVELEPPDADTRLCILELLSRRLQLSSDQMQILPQLARRLDANVRVLEGALTRLSAYSSLTGAALSLEQSERLLGALYQPEAAPRKPTIGHIQQKTAQALELEQADIVSPKRSRRVVYARQVAMYLSRELTSLSLPTIAAQFGGRDHTTVLHAHRKIQREAITNPSTRELVGQLQESIAGQQPIHS